MCVCVCRLEKFNNTCLTLDTYLQSFQSEKNV